MSKSLRVTVDAKNLDEFKELAQIVKDFVGDKEVPLHIRNKYAQRVNMFVGGNVNVK